MEQAAHALPESIRAWRVTQFGDADALRCVTLPVPELRNGEVLVEVQAAALNPVDLKTLQGRYPLISDNDLPYTLGRDVAGVVVRRAGDVEGWAEGTRVCAFVGQGQGTFADYVAVPASALADAPRHGAIDTAAAIPLAALTAWQGLFDHGKLQRGERVLIHGASGGVGRFAVQFARHCGAHVIVTASAQTRDALTALGAAEVIDYQSERFEESTGDIDLVFDLVGGATQARSWNVVKRGGAIVSTLGEPSQVEAARHGARATRYTASPNGKELAHIVKLFDDGLLKVEVVERFDFDAMKDAFERLGRAHVHGKLVVMRDAA